MATSTVIEDVSGSGGSDQNSTDDSESCDWEYTDKPDLPYQRGFKLTAMHHEPSEPFGAGYRTEYSSFPEGWKDMSQTECCTSWLPLEGRTDPTISKFLTITSVIRSGYELGAQILVVDHTMVAKIYDPLYYRGFNEFGYKNPVVYNADGDYCREAAAFEKLQGSAEARAAIPAYYGTWTMNIETPVQLSEDRMILHTRPVRFILMEHLHGYCMLDVDPFDLSEQVRSTILKKAIVAETLLYGAGVDHRDLSPRNIMISGFDYDSPIIPTTCVQVEVKILDFNIAILLTHPQAERRWMSMKSLKKKWPPKLRSPIMRYHGRMMEFSTRGWCSVDEDEAEKWLWHQFQDDDRYLPVVWDPNNPEKRPVYQNPEDAQYTFVLDTQNNVPTSHRLMGAGGGSSSSSSEGNKESDVGPVEIEPEQNKPTREASVIKSQL